MPPAGGLLLDDVTQQVLAFPAGEVLEHPCAVLGVQVRDGTADDGGVERPGPMRVGLEQQLEAGRRLDGKRDAGIEQDVLDDGQVGISVEDKTVLRRDAQRREPSWGGVSHLEGRVRRRGLVELLPPAALGGALEQKDADGVVPRFGGGFGGFRGFRGGGGGGGRCGRRLVGRAGAQAGDHLDDVARAAGDVVDDEERRLDAPHFAPVPERIGLREEARVPAGGAGDEAQLVGQPRLAHARLAGPEPPGDAAAVIEEPLKLGELDGAAEHRHAARLGAERVGQVPGGDRRRTRLDDQAGEGTQGIELVRDAGEPRGDLRDFGADGTQVFEREVEGP